MATLRSPTPWLVIGRVVAAVAGGWGFTWGFVTLGITALVAAGVGYGDARTLLYLLAFLVYLGVFLWAFAARSLKQVWLVLAGGGGAMTLAAWWMAQALG